MFSKSKAIDVRTGSKNRHTSITSGSNSQNAELNTFSSEMQTNESEHDNDSRRINETSDSESISTDGEETADKVPRFGSDKQSLKQSNHFKVALANSKALQGDYVELKNCKRCGCMIFKVSQSRVSPSFVSQDLSAAIKSQREEFNADVSPA